VALIELENESLTATVDASAGGRIASFEIHGREILVTSARSTYDWGLYPMVPYAGRVRDAEFEFDNRMHRLPVVTNGHALHGTVMHLDWDCESSTDAEATLSVDLGDQWPFRGHCTHRITLLPDRLRCALMVHAHESMPVQLGWHPWFRTPHSVDASFNAMLARDAHGITTDRRVAPADPPVDDCFLEPNAWPRVHFADAAVEIASDCPFWVRFDAPFGDVCIEPQSGPPNGINSAPLVLEAGKTFARWMELRVV
jgi:aldose 1-epimerase